jgi:hypothetical protein
MDSFGYIKDHKSWLNESLILNGEESLYLATMTASLKGNLLYRATRDGFTGQAFHTKCDGKANTITIILNKMNYIFGGFASSCWNTKGFIDDPKAFLFSLRRNGVSYKDKLTINNFKNALYGHSSYGPTFGGGHDIYINNQSDNCIGSYTNLGHSYSSNGHQYGTGNAQCFLAGNYNQWLVDEIEVFQII